MLTIQELEQFRDQCHSANRQWWIDLDTQEPIDRDPNELVALMHSEVSEALEGRRKGKQDPHCPKFKNETIEFVDAFIRLMDMAGGYGLQFYSENTSIPLLDVSSLTFFECIILLHKEFNSLIETILSIPKPFTNSFFLDYKIKLIANLLIAIVTHQSEEDFVSAYTAKMAYNKVRADHKHENRRKEGGKKF